MVKRVAAPPPVQVVNETSAQILARVVRYFTPRTKPGIVASKLAHTYAEVRAMLEAWDTVRDKLSEIEQKLSHETLPKAFEAEKIKTFTLLDGSRVTISDRLYASIIPEKRADAFAWLRKNRLKDLIIETVNASTLSAAAKLRVEANQDVPEDLFKVTIIPGASLTKGRPAKTAKVKAKLAAKTPPANEQPTS